MLLNLLGDVWCETDAPPDWSNVLNMPGATLHLYGKHEARRGRKMGHVTFTAPTLEEALANQNRAREILGIPVLP
ncbi:MAG: hypothetical protein CMO47_06935 [Verrucomicrobiales bacterium]|nr:hypothetical protein [Verrucomicrobiales bacterium]